MAGTVFVSTADVFGFVSVYLLYSCARWWKKSIILSKLKIYWQISTDLLLFYCTYSSLCAVSFMNNTTFIEI